MSVEGDFAAGEIPEISMNEQIASGFELPPERSAFKGSVGATDIPDQWSIPHIKPEDKHLVKLFGVLDESKWTEIGVELRRAQGVPPMVTNMMREMMQEVVYQMKARHNGLSAEDQGIVRSAATKTQTRVVTETVTKMPSGSVAVLMEVLSELMEFQSLDQCKGLSQAIVDGLEGMWA